MRGCRAIAGCSPDVHQEAGPGQFGEEEIGYHKTGKCTGRSDALEECGGLPLKGKNETRLMSPLLCPFVIVHAETQDEMVSHNRQGR
jgi:hypothetical protein